MAPIPGPEPPDDEADDEEVVPLADLVIVQVRPLLEREAEPGPEVHVADQPESGDQEDPEQQPPGGAVGAALLPQSAQAQRHEDRIVIGFLATSDSDRGPLPVEILEVVERAATQQREGAARVVRAVRDRRVVERCAGRVLRPADDREQGVERRGRRPR